MIDSKPVRHQLAATSRPPSKLVAGYLRYPYLGFRLDRHKVSAFPDCTLRRSVAMFRVPPFSNAHNCRIVDSNDALGMKPRESPSLLPHVTTKRKTQRRLKGLSRPFGTALG